MKLSLSTVDVPFGAIFTCHHVNAPFKWDKTTCLTVDGADGINSSHSISRYIARINPTFELYPSDILHRTEIDHWLTFSSGPLSCCKDISSLLAKLNDALATSNFLTANKLTISDYEIFGVLIKNKQWNEQLEGKSAPTHVLRWYNHIHKLVENCLNSLPNTISITPTVTSTDSKSITKEHGGKFVELPGAKMGEVVVRFPPEASGYLHIGHAKAALLNQYYQNTFKGKLIMRFDDTNPDKEKANFEKVIKEDLELLEIAPDEFTFTSDHFDFMIKKCEDLLNDGKAYVDNTDPETMKKEREERKESKNRNNSAQKNIEMFHQMKEGTDFGFTCCVRAKIDMTSDNGCMRDPTIYRCKREPHVKTLDKYKVYPTYDFACPIVDSREGVTHALRTTEYHDRDDQYYWFINALGLRTLHIYEYSRLNMNNTVLSKRKLTWFVDEGLVDGWDDPRFPTVRGILRKGMTVEGLKDFIIAQGSSRSVVNMEWDKIWAFNKKVIDRVAPRYTALEGQLVPVSVTNAVEATTQAQKHPKDPTKGMKTVWTGPNILIEAVDAAAMKEGDNATFINWGNLKIVKINKENDKITSLVAETNLSNVDYKKTLKLTWIADTVKCPSVPVVCVHFGHLLNKTVLGKDDDFKNFVAKDTRREVRMLGDNELITLKSGDIIQLQRKGFYRVDVPYKAISAASCQVGPVILFAIPDGHVPKESVTSVAGTSIKKATMSVKESKESAKGKLSEKSPQDEVKSLPSNDILLDIHSQIKVQGDKIRTLKGEKAEKSTIMSQVDILKGLKEDFKKISGVEWKMDMDLNQFSTSAEVISANSASNDDASACGIHDKITNQGNRIRKLKTEKAEKSIIMVEVEALKMLKSDFKSATGVDWKPDIDMTQFSPAANATEISNVETTGEGGNSMKIHEGIKSQGDKIRNLKSEKAEKSIILAEVTLLKALKEDFKSDTGVDWKPDIDMSQFSAVSAVVCSKQPEISSPKPIETGGNAKNIHEKIKSQGDKIRNLKTEKAEKSTIIAEVTVLKALKEDFKNDTGTEWKPDIDLSQFAGGVKSVSSASAVVSSKVTATDSVKIHEDITAQGDKIRKLKTEKADKAVISAEVIILKALKEDFKNDTGTDWKPDWNKSKCSSVSGPTASKEAKSIANKAIKESAMKPEESQLKKQTRLGVEVNKEDNLSLWYSQVITKSEMIDYYDVSGCYILRPWSYAIWDFIKDYIDKEIKKLGVKNAYFPIFVSKDALEKEKSHIADFRPEVAWVTKSGDTEMAEPVAIRPTSETAMYPAYAKWIQSHRDLPLKLNQWNNVVRWEFKQPTPFLRTREFLWQEGHTAFATKEEATEEVYTILEIYASVYKDLLAVPVVKGRKTEKEKFAGGDFTTTTEAYIVASGRAIQGATSHHLGQNFSKMFNIVFEDPKTKEERFVYQNSWGLTTRSIGVMVMVHGDNKGLCIPPRVADIQVVIVPVGVTAKTTDQDKEKLLNACHQLTTELKDAGIRAEPDLRDNVTPAWKFNHWELKGVPLRIELGPRELAKGEVFVVRRDTGEKQQMSRSPSTTSDESSRSDLVGQLEALTGDKRLSHSEMIAKLAALSDKSKRGQSSVVSDKIRSLLTTIQSDMLAKAAKQMADHKVLVHEWKDFLIQVKKGNLLLAPFCGVIECEDAIKKDSAVEEPSEVGAPSMGAKGLCIPFDQPGDVKGKKCIHPNCSRPAKFYTLFGRSY